MRVAFLALDLFLPVFYLCLSRVCRKAAKEKIQALIGYRTPRSTASQAAWEKANLMLAHFLWQSGWALLFVGGAFAGVAWFFFSVEAQGTLCLVLFLLGSLVPLLSMIPIERELKKSEK